MFILMAMAAVVRKYGLTLTSLVTFDVLADLMDYGWTWLPSLYNEGLTYGPFRDLATVIGKRLIEGKYVVFY